LLCQRSYRYQDVSHLWLQTTPYELERTNVDHKKVKNIHRAALQHEPVDLLITDLAAYIYPEPTTDLLKPPFLAQQSLNKAQL
jgi:hypothetical protein